MPDNSNKGPKLEDLKDKEIRDLVQSIGHVELVLAAVKRRLLKIEGRDVPYIPEEGEGLESSTPPGKKKTPTTFELGLVARPLTNKPSGGGSSC